MPNSTRTTPFVVFGVCLAALALSGWVRPQPPTTAKAPAAGESKLDFVVIEVNGEAKVVRSGEELAVIHGDHLVLKDAALLGKAAAPKIGELNLVGYQSPKAKRSGEDRGFSFTTDEIKSKYSENGTGNVYAVTATTKGTLHGTVYLRLIDPVLRYAELTVNGKKAVLRDGEEIEIGPQDLVKVEKVVTNLASTEGVTFQMVPAGETAAATVSAVEQGKAPPAATAGSRYEIRFLRHGRPFAGIPLSVK